MDFRKYVIPALLFVVTFFVYLHNLSISIYGGDAGDFVTAAFVGGVPHPPGYPLFTLLGFLLTRIHLFPSPAFAVGLISVLSGAVGVGFFYVTIKQLTKNTVISLIASGILAFNYLFWFYSEIPEVFSLNNLFFIVLMYVSLKMVLQKSLRLLPLFFFITGLSFTNQQTIIFAFPSLLLCLCSPILHQIKKRKIPLKTILFSILGFCLGLSLYVYVPLASSHNPVINWDTVKDIPSFLHLLLRKDYGTFSAGIYLAPSVLQRLVIVKAYLLQILFQLTIPVIVISVFGFLYLLQKQRLFAVSILLGFLLSGPLFIGYAGFPLTGSFYFGVNERFFLLSTLFLLYLFPFGLVFVTDLFKKVSRINPVVVQAVFFIIPLMLFLFNFPKTDLSHVFLGDTFAEDLLLPLPKNAIVILGGDTTIFNSWYVHYALHVRPDVHILNLEGNIGSPYFSVLEAAYVKKHPHATKQQSSQGVINSLPNNGTVFSVSEIDKTGSNDKWIPYGLVLELTSHTAIPQEQDYTQMTNHVWSQMHVPHLSQASLAAHNDTIADIPDNYANAMLLTGDFYMSEYQDPVEAKVWYDRALAVDSGYEKTYSSLAVWDLVEKHCSEATANAQKALRINPLTSVNYFLLYAAYQGCLHEPILARNVAKQFSEQFQIPFAKALKSFNAKQ